MKENNNLETIKEDEENLPDPQELIEEIRQSSERLIIATQEFIEWSKADTTIVVEELIRVRNFCDAVIEANPITYQLSTIMAKVELDEPTLRQLLKDVGVEIDVGISDPEESITQKDLVALLADRAGSREGALLAELIRGNKRAYTCR
jgi:signal transduction histidine kinase